MTFKSKSQAGVVHLQFLLLLAIVVGVIGLAGYAVVQSQSDTYSNATESSVAPTASAPSDIKSTADLNKAKAYLNSASIDKDINSSSLNSDVNSLL